MIFGKRTNKDRNLFYFSVTGGATFLVVLFVFVCMRVLGFFGVIGWLSDSFYSYMNKDIGVVAGEFEVQMAQSGGTNFYPSYPKIMRHGAMFPQTTRDGASYPDGATPLIWSKSDMVAFSSGGLGTDWFSEFAREIKEISPETIVLGFTNSLLRMPASAPDDYGASGSYFTHRADGSLNGAYGGLANFTKKDAGPYAIYNSADDGFYNGLSSGDLQYFDGVLYPDGRSGWAPYDLCDDNRYVNSDFNENGLVDADESPNTCGGGSDVTAVNERWRVGYDARMAEEHSRGSSISGKDWKVVINDGGPPIGDTVGSNFKNVVDGFMFENAPDWQTTVNILIDWDNNGSKPSLINLIGTIGRNWDNFKAWKEDGQKNWSKMRRGLTTTMLGDAFYGHCLGEGNTICFWYDEFDLDLGQPISGGRHKLTDPKFRVDRCRDVGYACSEDQIWYPYVRFFERGALIVNYSGQPLTVSDEDINVLAGYSGPYWRFNGGQDAGFNNGQAFGSVTLNSTEKQEGNGWWVPTSGDGIILVNTEDLYSVADITVGNGDHDDTTPGSEPVRLTGDWKEDWTVRDSGGNGNPYYTQYLGNWLDDDINEGYGYRYSTTAGDTAEYIPTIGIGGEYEVYEWHGWHGNGADSVNEVVADVEITHAGGVDSLTVDQSADYGQWNLLGTYTFGVGESGSVRFTHPGGGSMLADVVRFVFVGNSLAGRSLIPDFNCDGKVDIQDFGIMLSHWDSTSGHEVACDSSKTIDIAPDSESTDVIEGDGIVNSFDMAKLLSCWGVPSADSCWMVSSTPGTPPPPTPEDDCGNGVIDTGEVCDPGPPDMGVPANGVCQYNCHSWSCEYGYREDGGSCVLVQPPTTGACAENQYSDQTIVPVAYDSLARPNLGESYDDPSFCTTVTRISDSENAYVVNSEPMYFNSDDSYFMSRDDNINYLYSASSGQRVMEIGGGDFRPFAVRWSRTEPMVFYQVISSGINRCVVNVSSSGVSCSQYSGIGGLGTGGDPIGEGDLSYDGRYWLLDQGGELVVFDFQTRNISSRSGLSISDGVDYGVMSPSGKYVLVAWGTDQSAAHYGIELYDASSWNMLKRMHVIPVHFEVGLDDQGNEMMFSMAGNTLDDLEYLKSTHNISDLEMWNIFGAYLQYNGGRVLLKNTKAVHHMAAFPDGQRDYVYFALEEKRPDGADRPDPDQVWGPYWGEILQIPTDGSGLVKRLVHHRTHKTDVATYQKVYQPDFIVSNDGKTIVFNSTFGVEDSKCDLYMLRTDQVVTGGGGAQVRGASDSRGFGSTYVVLGIATFFAFVGVSLLVLKKVTYARVKKEIYIKK